jgi:hypothetical protein
MLSPPVITSTFENVSEIGVCLGLSPGPPAKPVSGQNREQFTAALANRELAKNQSAAGVGHF